MARLMETFQSRDKRLPSNPASPSALSVICEKGQNTEDVPQSLPLIFTWACRLSGLFVRTHIPVTSMCLNTFGYHQLRAMQWAYYLSRF